MAMAPQASRPERSGCPPSTSTPSISPRWAIHGVWVPRASPGAWVWVAGGKLAISIPALTIEDGAEGYYLFANQRLWFRNPGIDNAGLIGYLQFGHTGSQTSMVNTYLGGGLTAIGMIPGRHDDTLSLGLAYSELNDTPGAGAFFFPRRSLAIRRSRRERTHAPGGL
jgi:hypothetical protein